MKEEKEIGFEESMKKLEEIAVQLEKGDLNLDESVEKFEEGIHLAKKCNETLEKAEKRISILIQKEEEIAEKNFAAESDI